MGFVKDQKRRCEEGLQLELFMIDYGDLAFTFESKLPAQFDRPLRHEFCGRGNHDANRAIHYELARYRRRFDGLAKTDFVRN
ncbi:MAG TPA: hypothetical protein VG944_17670 [Fimbriimonas sp.]|nr:hypothetical protein [Fimbriimonas sp.]